MKKGTPSRINDLVVAELKTRRAQLGFSQDQLAEKTGLHRSAISLIESGKRHPTVITLIKISMALDASLGDLIKAAESKH